MWKWKETEQSTIIAVFKGSIWMYENNRVRNEEIKKIEMAEKVNRVPCGVVE